MFSRFLEKYWQIGVVAAFLLLLVFTWLAFHPGLGGTLIFDDIPNFQPWQDLGDIDSTHKAWTFMASASGIPGRPLSLLSFLIDDQSWPPDIHALKRTNLAIHLINASLLFWLCLGLFRRLLNSLSPARQATVALLATAVWALHPLQVSNVSYIIQRMNLLSTMLELAGMVVFLHGRSLLSSTPLRGAALCTAAIALVPLAILAKENGLLLCAFLLLIERFCFPPAPQAWWRYWKLAFLWSPLILFVIYCLIRYHGFIHPFATRDFNAWERLLTQGPVLLDYLDKLLLPRLHGTGLYFDNFPVSRSLLAPPGTLLAWLLLAALMGLAWQLRQRQPVLAFGIFFYFVGHLMESTVLPLELYYEHRNYLPQAGLWIALAGLAGQAQAATLKRLLVGFSAMLLALLFVMTRANAAIWSDPQSQAAIWYHENPGSLRTTLTYANLLLESRRFDELDHLLTDAQRLHPNSLALVVSQRFVQCYWRDRPTRFDDLPTLAEHADYEVASITTLENMKSINRERRDITPRPEGCRAPTTREIADIYLALLQNPAFRGSRLKAPLKEFIAEAAVEARDLNKAMEFYDAAFAASPLAIYPYRQALLLVSAGLTDDAFSYLARAQNALTLKQRVLYPDLEQRIASLRSELQQGSLTVKTR